MAPRAVRASSFRNCAEIVSTSSKLCPNLIQTLLAICPVALFGAAFDLVYHLELHGDFLDDWKKCSNCFELIQTLLTICPVALFGAAFNLYSELPFLKLCSNRPSTSYHLPRCIVWGFWWFWSPSVTAWWSFILKSYCWVKYGTFVKFFRAVYDFLCLILGISGILCTRKGF